MYRLVRVVSVLVVLFGFAGASASACACGAGIVPEETVPSKEFEYTLFLRGAADASLYEIVGPNIVGYEDETCSHVLDLKSDFSWTGDSGPVRYPIAYDITIVDATGKKVQAFGNSRTMPQDIGPLCKGEFYLLDEPLLVM